MYNKKDLMNLEFGSKEFMDVVENINFLMSKKQKLNYAESEFIYSLFRSNQGKNTFLTLFSTFQEYLRIPNFMYKYLVYIGDFESLREIKNAHNGFFSKEEIKEDILMFEKEYLEWKPKMEKFNHKNDLLLNIISSEFNEELKQLKKIVNTKLFRLKEKAIILHSKHIYHKVDAMFEDTNRKDVYSNWIYNLKIRIDYKSLVHIFRGHFAGKAKQFETYKDFHFDKNIDHDNLHYFMKNILDELGKYISIDLNRNSSIPIPIEWNKTIYEIWIKKIKPEANSYHLETFYPVGNPKRLNELSKLRKNYCTINLAYLIE